MNPTIYINVFTAVVLFVLGILLITGLLASHINIEMRLIFGIIFLSYGIFRTVNVYSKLKLRKQENKLEEMKKARENLFKDE